MKTFNETDLASYLNDILVQPLGQDRIVNYYPIFTEFLANPNPNTYQVLHTAMKLEGLHKAYKSKLPEALSEKNTQDNINFLALFAISEVVDLAWDEIEPQNLPNDIDKESLLIVINKLLVVVRTATLALTGLDAEQQLMKGIVKNLEEIKETLELSIEFETWNTRAA